MNILKLFFRSLPASNAPSGAINEMDLLKIVRLAFVGGVGYALTMIAELLAGSDFGMYQPIVQVGLMALTETGRRLLADKPIDLELPANPGEDSLPQ